MQMQISCVCLAVSCSQDNLISYVEMIECCVMHTMDAHKINTRTWTLVLLAVAAANAALRWCAGSIQTNDVWTQYYKERRLYLHSRKTFIQMLHKFTHLAEDMFWFWFLCGFWVFCACPFHHFLRWRLRKTNIQMILRIHFGKNSPRCICVTISL